MYPSESTPTFRLFVSLDDWKAITSTLHAYSHNAEYRELLSRLERQAALVGLPTSTPRPS